MVTFVFGTSRQDGAILGQNIPPLGYKAFWIRQNTRFGAQGVAPNAAILRILCDNLVTEVIDQAPQPSPSTSFTVIGETDANQTLQDIINKIIHRNANFCICVGNNLLNSTNAEDWFKILGPSLSQITKLAFGQKDTQVQALINQYLNKYGLDKKYHSFTYQNAHFLFMDTSSPDPTTWNQASEQYEFIVADLISASSDPTIDWIIVVMNRAMYASQTTTTTKYILKQLRDLYHPLFEQYGVHAVLNGYFNNYQRQHCLHYNSSNSDLPTPILPGQIPNYTIPQGVQGLLDNGIPGCLFLNIGMGGAAHDNIPTLNSHTAFANTANFGYMLVDLVNTQIDRTLQFKFHNSLDNQLIDFITITKTL